MQAFDLQKKITDRRKSYTVKVNVPMCDLHFRAATHKGTVERFVGTLGSLAGLLAGLFAILLVPFRGAGTGNILRNLFAGGAVGFGSCLSVWAIISVFLAPFLAAPASREARHAVRFTRYWPRDQFVRLEFQDEQLADIVQNTY